MRLKEYLTLKRTLLLIAMIASIICFFTSFNHVVSIEESIANTCTTLSNPVWGKNGFYYSYTSTNALDLFNQNNSTAIVNISDKNFTNPAIAVLLISFILIPLLGIGAFVCDFIVKDKKTNTIIGISIAGVLFILTFLLCFSKAFEKKWIIERVTAFNNTGISISNDKFYNCKCSGIFGSVFYALLSTVCVGLTLVFKDCPLPEVKDEKWHLSMMEGIKKAFKWVKNLFKKKEKKVEPKKPLPMAEAEVVHSPKVDVSGEPKGVSEPEFEKVTSSLNGEKNTEEIKKDKESTTKKPSSKKSSSSGSKKTTSKKTNNK